MSFTSLGMISGTKVTNYNYKSQNDVFTSIEFTSAGSRKWLCLSSSNDGTILLAGVHAGYFYLSTDSGITWSEFNSYEYSSWTTIKVSYDGSTLIAGGNSVPASGGAYTETGLTGTNLHVSNDRGITWNEPSIPLTSYRHWYSACSSSNGTILYACSKQNHIVTSTDSGNTWTQLVNSGLKEWNGIDCSSDGTKLIACAYGNYVYISTNSGINWTSAISSITTRFWSGVASSSDGTKLFGVVNGSSSNYYYYSLNSGNSWYRMEQTTNDIRRTSVSTSNNGGVVSVARGGNHYITISYNYGSTWTTITSMPLNTLKSPVVSGDGKRIFIGVYNGYLYSITGF
jgi:photosystem II stability/assembly factor-like uncharacterized protein